MNKLDKAREEINEADLLIIEAFKKRMKAVKEVLLYKKENNLEILDTKREDIVKNKNINLLNNKELEKYYLEVLDSLLKVSKDYQKDLLNE